MCSPSPCSALQASLDGCARCRRLHVQPILYREDSAARPYSVQCAERASATCYKHTMQPYMRMRKGGATSVLGKSMHQLVGENQGPAHFRAKQRGSAALWNVTPAVPAPPMTIWAQPSLARARLAQCCCVESTSHISKPHPSASLASEALNSIGWTETELIAVCSSDEFVVLDCSSLFCRALFHQAALISSLNLYDITARMLTSPQFSRKNTTTAHGLLVLFPRPILFDAYRFPLYRYPISCCAHHVSK
jgi:hypothetical protein